MECPKCHSIVADNLSICPNCNKVLQLECPNCGALGQDPVCEKCGYTVLVKCSKCSRIIHTGKEYCSKCRFPVKTSVAYQECESDDFAAIVVSFGNLKGIKRALKSTGLYAKFLLKLKNLLMVNLKNADAKVIIYGDSYVININKELSFTTSSNKAVRLAVKIINAFVELNTNLINEYGFPLGLKLSVVRKNSEQLLDQISYATNVKQLLIKKETVTHIKGFQLELDQYVWEQIKKDYKTDSLYSIDFNGESIMFYEVLLASYVLPPSEADANENVKVALREIKNEILEPEEKDMYSFKVFDINAKCAFETVNASKLLSKLKEVDLNKNGKIISIKSEKTLGVNVADLVGFYQAEAFKVLSINCSEIMNYKPWGFFEALFRANFNLPLHNAFINTQSISPDAYQKFKPIFEFILGKPLKAASPEDARFAYMEHFSRFLAGLSKTVIIVEGFEFLDDTSVQTLDLYFDKFKRISPNFVFINTSSTSVHSKFKGLLRTSLYTEFLLKKSSLDYMVSTLKSDATDFIQSFYYEKLQENCKGSWLYFSNLLSYLKETGVLIDYQDKLLVKNNKSVVVPKTLEGVIRARIKNQSKNTDLSLILAYSSILGPRIDFETLKKLGIKEVEKNAKYLQELGLVRVSNDIIYINNFDLILPVIKVSLKKDIQVFLAKNIMAQLGKGLDDTTLMVAMGILDASKEQYLTLWKNSYFAISTGDYDAYLKNCLGFLTLIEKIKDFISLDDIEDNKKEVYNNILMYLYNYSPEKIYFIENILLMDAIKQGDNDKIVKLSNLMLQGALITTNYTDALGLLHNILSRMPNATWIVDGKVNTKFLLLSLVNIEVLYNIGNYKLCVETAEELIKVLNSNIIEQIKPSGFSLGLFVSHIMDIIRLATLAKIFLLDDDIEEFIAEVEKSLKVEFEDKNCILAIRDYFAGESCSTQNVEQATPFAKTIYLILQESSGLVDDYKSFAQNIYQAKLLANDIHQKEIEYLCDLLIAYSYSKIGITDKAESIYNDILQVSEKNAVFGTLLLTKYLLAKMSIDKGDKSNALILVNDSLSLLQKMDNKAKLFYVLFELLYIELIKENPDAKNVIAGEIQKISRYKIQMKVAYPDDLEDYFSIQEDADAELNNVD